jgi:hypothetical protein
MIDGLKFILYYNLDFFRNHPLLDFQTATSVTTGEVIKQKNPLAKYRGFIFEDRIKNIEIRGSIHKYFNEGKHNWNDFGINELILSIKEFCSVFNIDPSKIKLDNLEIGVNINMTFKPAKFLESLIMCAGNQFDWNSGSNMNYRECELSQYYIKIYDKGLQYHLSNRIMRFEIKFVKMECPNRLGIKCLSDLVDEDKIKDLSKELIRIYDDIYMGDISVNLDHLSPNNKEFFLKGHQLAYWKSEKPQKSLIADDEFKRSYKIYERKLKHFRDLLEDTGANEKKKLFRKLIESKIKQLLDPNNSIHLLGEMTGFAGISNGGNDRPEIKEVGEMTGFDFQSYGGNDQYMKTGEMTGSSKIQIGGNDTLLYRDIYPINRRLCLVTGLDISMQKESSSFLCTTGIKFYQKNQPDIWRELKNRLSEKWLAQKEFDQIREVAHSIRNEFNNSKRDVGKCYRYPSLFDQREFIREDKLRLFFLKSQPIANNNKIQCHAI